MNLSNSLTEENGRFVIFINIWQLIFVSDDVGKEKNIQKQKEQEMPTNTRR